MSRLYDREEADGAHIFFMPNEQEEYEIRLTQENCLMQVFRAEHYKDRFAIQDVRDGLSWQWWRSATPETDFDHMEDVAIGVGIFVLQEYAPEWVNDLFDKAPHNQLSETELDRFLEADDGNAA